MRIFVTGATGFVGSYLVPELIKAGHCVVGLSRSDAGAEALTRAGAEVFRGDMNDLYGLRTAAEAADGVIHAAFNHDFSKLEQNAADERKAIGAIGEALVGSKRPFVVTSATGMAVNVDGKPSTEDSPVSPWNPRAGLETVIKEFTDRGVTTSIVRLSQVHDTRRQGLVTSIIQTARQQGRVAYVGEGRNRWPAVHVSDAVRLFRLALEKGQAGARYHAVGEEGVALRDIAKVIGEGLKIPVESITPKEAPEYFGWMAELATIDLAASSTLTRQQLGWNPAGPDLLTDLRNMDYGAA